MIIKIDEEKGDGLCECVPSCAEGAIHSLMGRLNLFRKNNCDGLVCCKSGPNDASKVLER